MKRLVLEPVLEPALELVLQNRSESLTEANVMRESSNGFIALYARA